MAWDHEWEYALSHGLMLKDEVDGYQLLLQQPYHGDLTTSGHGD